MLYTNTELLISNKMELTITIYIQQNYEGWNFNSGNYLFTTDTK